MAQWAQLWLCNKQISLLCGLALPGDLRTLYSHGSRTLQTQKEKGKKCQTGLFTTHLFSLRAAVNQPWRIMSGSASPGRRALCTYSVWKKSLWVTLQTISELCLVFLGWHNKRKISFSEGPHPEGYQMVPGSGTLNSSHCWPHPTSDTPPLSRNATASPHAVTVDVALSLFAPGQFSVCCLD